MAGLKRLKNHSYFVTATMKLLILTVITGLLPFVAQSQTTSEYAQLMEQSGAAMQAKNPCAAVGLFQRAFAPDSMQASPFDLFAAAMSAAQCPAEQQLAWRWLGQLSRRRPLPMQPRDLDNILADPGLASLQANKPAWTSWLTAMRAALAEQAAADRARSARWLTETQARARALPASADRKRSKAAPAGFALCFSQVPGDTVRVPYLVRVPAGYDPARPAPMVVYLHGGVGSTPQFRHGDPDVIKEPIFAAAPPNALVVYPFGRASFGWVAQPAAFAQVARIVVAVQARYRTNPARTTLVGMSNGGSAALWFAAQPTTAFSHFVALSPAPVLPLARQNYGALGKDKPFVLISALDDDVYAYAAVRAAYDAHRSGRPRWQFQTVPKGGHGFLYGPEGVQLLRQALWVTKQTQPSGRLPTPPRRAAARLAPVPAPRPGPAETPAPRSTHSE